ncbi:hypothetical protein ES703_84873 [subsurface metagenome]
MKDEKFILYVQTSDVPERQYSPLVLAQTAKNMELNPKVYYLGQALKMLLPGEAEKVKLGAFPSIAEMINDTLEMGIEVLVFETGGQDSWRRHPERLGTGRCGNNVVLGAQKWKGYT